MSLIFALILAILITAAAAGIATAIVDWVADMTWSNLFNIFTTFTWTLISPWVSVLVTPVAYKAYLHY